MVDLLFTSAELGLLYSLVVLGVFLSFRVLDYPDLTVDGSFVTGAAVTALGIHAGFPGEVALAFGFGAGFLAGCLTAFLHVQLGIEKILSGILSLGMLYSINLRIMGGPNLSLLNQDTVLGVMKAPLNHGLLILALGIVAFSAKLLVDWFLSTEFGLQFRATGGNEHTARSIAVNLSRTKFLGIGLGNAFMGLAGGFAAQYLGFADVNMGIGNIIFGLAALMIGEALFTSKKVPMMTLGLIVGALIYELIVNVALRLGLAGTDLKLVTALIVIIALVAKDGKRFVSYGKRILGS